MVWIYCWKQARNYVMLLMCCTHINLNLYVQKVWISVQILGSVFSLMWSRIYNIFHYTLANTLLKVIWVLFLRIIKPWFSQIIFLLDMMLDSMCLMQDLVHLMVAHLCTLACLVMHLVVLDTRPPALNYTWCRAFWIFSWAFAWLISGTVCCTFLLN